MGLPDQNKEILDELERIRGQAAKLGLEPNEFVVDQGTFGKPKLAVKSFRTKDEAIKTVATADPANIQEVFASQLKINDEYYTSVLSQAKQSFRAALVAASIGLAFFVAAISFLLVSGSTDVSVISLVSGAVVEVVAGVNFWLYGQTARQLGTFHARIEQSQRFILANSVAANLEGDAKQETQSNLVRLIATSMQMSPDSVPWYEGGA